MCTDFLKKLFHCNKGKYESAISCQKIQIVRNRDASVVKFPTMQGSTIMYVLPKSIKEYYVDDTKVVLIGCDNKDQDGALYFLFDSTDENAMSLKGGIGNMATVRIEDEFYDCYYIIEGQSVQVLTTIDFTV